MTVYPEPTGGFPPPRRRLTLELSLQADDLEELSAVLSEVQRALEYEGVEEWETSAEGIWFGYRLSLTCDESMNGERYRELALHHRQTVQEEGAG